MKAHVEAFVARRWSIPPERLALDLQPLAGGLESSVFVATFAPTQDSPEAFVRIVVKEMPRGGDREADIYESLARHLTSSVTARVLGIDAVGHSRYVYLEEVQPFSAWPWSNTEHAAAVCRVLGSFHETASLPVETFAWDYEAELAGSAELTLAVARQARDHTGARYWQRIGDLSRVVRALPAIRSQLLDSFGSTVIHGDLHPGNVILRRGHPDTEVALIDWGRARIGSPLEDVASWLHSLGCWEPEARRRHDTLLRAYLASRRDRWPLSAGLRACYGFACVSNGLAGAIRYHLSVVSRDDVSEGMRRDSWQALTAWSRVVRRAAALISTSGDC